MRVLSLCDGISNTMVALKSMKEYHPIIFIFPLVAIAIFGYVIWEQK